MEARIRKLLRNTLSNVGLKIFQQILGLTVVPVMITTVGEEGYGLLMLTASLLGYFGLLGAGVPAGTIKFVAEYEAKGDREKVADIINSSLGFFTAIGLVVSLALVIFSQSDLLLVFQISPQNQPVARDMLLIAAGISLVSWPGSVMQNTLKGLQQFHQKNLIEGLFQVLSLGSVIIAALLGASVPLIFGIQNGILALQYVLMYRVARKHLPDWHFRPWAAKRSVLRMIFGLSIWVLLAQVASMLFYTTDQVILGIVLPVSALAIYKVVTQPFHVIRQFLAMFNSAVMPAVSGIEQTDGVDGRNRLLMWGTRYSNGFMACLAVGGALMSRSFIRLWVGEAYVEYAWIAEVACLFQLVWQSNGFFGVVYIGTGRAFRLTAIAFVSALLNLGLSIWWAQTIGVGGVVLATMAAGCLAVPIQYFLLMPALEVNRVAYLKTVVFAQMPALVVGLTLVPALPWIQGIDSWLVFGVATLAIGAALALVTWYAVVATEHKGYVVRALKRRLKR